MYLDEITLLDMRVGYGDVGLHGNLGYDDQAVMVGGQNYRHAVSSHPPARLRFELEGRYAGFSCQVAINDDVPAGRSHAHFFLHADGVEVGCAPYVISGAPPRDLSADVNGAQILELIVETTVWDFCHAVWLDPKLTKTSVSPRVGILDDCLSRARIELPPPR